MLQLLEESKVDVNPNPIYEMAMGFAATKALLAAQRLGFFEALSGHERTAAQVAEEKGYPARTTELLLDTCVALGLCRKMGARYANLEIAERYLIPGRRGYLGRFLDHFNDLMYPGWLHLEEAVRTGHAQIQKVVGEPKDNFFQAIDRQMQHLRTFMQTMEEHSLLEGEALAGAYDFSTHRVLLDVAGGTGAMSVAIGEKNPHLRFIVFDRPPVIEMANESIRAHGMSDRFQTVSGDMFQDALPKGADIALLSAILHNWSPTNAQAILKKIHEALPSGGTLLISEQVLEDRKTGPLAGLLCSLNMLVMMEGAQEYSRAELESFLSEAGFDLLEVRPTGSVRKLLITRRR